MSPAPDLPFHADSGPTSAGLCGLMPGSTQMQALEKQEHQFPQGFDTSSLPRKLGWLEHLPYAKVAGLIPGQDTCKKQPMRVSVSTTATRCLFLSLSKVNLKDSLQNVTYQQ